MTDQPIHEHLDPHELLRLAFAESVIHSAFEGLASLSVFSDEAARDAVIAHVNQPHLANALAQVAQIIGNVTIEPEPDQLIPCPGCEGTMPEGYRICDECAE